MITARARPRRVRPRPRGDRGASSVEYGLLVAAITAVIVAVVFSVGIKVKDAFDETCQSLATAQSAADPPTGLKGVVADRCT